MIEIRPATIDDAFDLALNLHDMTRNEFENAGVGPRFLLAHLRTFAVMPGASAVMVDGSLAAVAYSVSIGDRKRATGFAAARGNGRQLVLAARRWAARERGQHPSAEFVAFCFSTHPERDRFMAALGMKRVGEHANFCVFSDSQASLDMAQSLLYFCALAGVEAGDRRAGLP